jgi:hypothetical protein
MEGAALATPQSSKHAKNRKATLAIGWERSRGSDIFPPRSSRLSFLSETAYLKRADNLVPVPIVCQLAQNRYYAQNPLNEQNGLISSTAADRG